MEIIYLQEDKGGRLSVESVSSGQWERSASSKAVGNRVLVVSGHGDFSSMHKRDKGEGDGLSVYKRMLGEIRNLYQ